MLFLHAYKYKYSAQGKDLDENVNPIQSMVGRAVFCAHSERGRGARLIKKITS